MKIIIFFFEEIISMVGNMVRGIDVILHVEHDFAVKL